jgi:hypothetical protein
MVLTIGGSQQVDVGDRGRDLDTFMVCGRFFCPSTPSYEDSTSDGTCTTMGISEGTQLGDTTNGSMCTPDDKLLGCVSDYTLSDGTSDVTTTIGWNLK